VSSHRSLNPSRHEAVAERILLVIAGLFVVVNLAALNILRGVGSQDWAPILVWIAAAAGGHLVLERRLPNHDPLLFPLVMMLSGFGIAVIDRLAPVFADRQAAWLLLSTAALVFSAAWPTVLRLLRDYRYLLFFGGLGLLLASFVFGVNPSGQPGAPTLWLGAFGLYFQPAEILKIVLVAFLASYLAEQFPLLSSARANRALEGSFLSPRLIGPVLLMWGICLLVLIWQRDLGAALVFFLVFLLLLYAASGRLLVLAAGGVLIVAAGVLAYSTFPVVTQRVDIWIDPWSRAEGSAYQIVQSLIAVSAGGAFGQGIGQGSPAYVPVVHSDAVYAAVAEEWGLLGAAFIVLMLLVLVARGLRVGIRLTDRPFSALLSTGLTLVIGVQSLLILGGVMRLIPLTGITLPFVSYGGSSLLVSFVMVGVLLRLSAEDPYAI
jgi:cell division protein FtsW